MAVGARKWFGNCLSSMPPQPAFRARLPTTRGVESWIMPNAFEALAVKLVVSAMPRLERFGIIGTDYRFFQKGRSSSSGRKRRGLLECLLFEQRSASR
jgi:hypothetical protein